MYNNRVALLFLWGIGKECKVVIHFISLQNELEIDGGRKWNNY